MSSSTPNLRKSTIRAGYWTVGGHLANQGLRFVGNLILTRLLFPDAFGLMAIVQSVMVGIALLSDVGITPSIIRHEHGEQPRFLNTGWTLQAVRGVSMYLVLLLLTIPMAKFYNQPMLMQLLPVVGFTAILNGLVSTRVPLANRHMQLSKVTLLEVGSYVIGLVAMVVIAWLDRSIWALVWGGLIGTASKAVLSHLVFGRPHNTFAWDKESLHELIHFGRWVMLGSMVTFLAGEGSRLVAAKFLGMEHMAYFTIAMTLNLMLQQLITQVGDKALYPAYAKLNREDPERLYRALRKSRMVQIVPSWLVSVGFVFLGGWLIGLLYDPRYAQAGWMLQIVAMGPLVGGLSRSYGGILWAKGLASTNTKLLSAQVIVQWSAMLVGHYFWGMRGVILSFPMSGWAMYPLHALVYKKLGVWQPEVDILVILCSAMVAFVALYWVGV
ncbi:MAG TPA: oligosaccharide flippase family protein [Parasulfuritortus sp.]